MVVNSEVLHLPVRVARAMGIPEMWTKSNYNDVYSRKKQREMFRGGDDRGHQETPEETTISTICNLVWIWQMRQLIVLELLLHVLAQSWKNSNNHKDNSSDCVQHLELAAVAQVWNLRMGRWRQESPKLKGSLAAWWVWDQPLELWKSLT